MFTFPNGKITNTQLLLPVSLVSFVLFIMLAFQTTQLMRDRASLHQARSQQDKPLEDVEKVKNQLNALAVGALKLSEKGNKNARAIIDRMKQMGITINASSPGDAAAVGAKAPSAAPAPAQPAKNP